MAIDIKTDTVCFDTATRLQRLDEQLKAVRKDTAQVNLPKPAEPAADLFTDRLSAAKAERIIEALLQPDAVLEEFLQQTQTDPATELSIPGLDGESAEVHWTLLLEWQPDANKSIAENIGELCSRYKQLYHFINLHFTDVERARLLNRLGLIYSGKLEMLLTAMKPLCEFLEENGQPEAADKIRPSLEWAAYQAVDSRAAKNAPFPSGSGRTDQTGREPGLIKENPERLLLKQSPKREASAQISIQSSSSTVLKYQKGFYFVEELQEAGRFLRNLPESRRNSAYFTDPVCSSLKTDKQRDVQTALLPLKAEVFAKYAGVRPELSLAVRGACGRWTQAVAQSAREPAGQALRTQRAQPGFFAANLTSQREAAELGLRMAAEYRRTGDLRAAFSVGTRLPEKPQAENDPSAERRAARLHFFESGDRPPVREELRVGEPFRRPSLQLMKENWNDFIRGLRLTPGEREKLFFAVYDSGVLELLQAKTPFAKAALLRLGLGAAILCAALVLMGAVFLLAAGPLPLRLLWLALLPLLVGGGVLLMLKRQKAREKRRRSHVGCGRQKN